MRLVWGVALHIVLPVAIVLYPMTFDMRLRDFADFYPEQAAVGLMCAALLLAGGVAEVAARRRRVTCR